MMTEEELKRTIAMQSAYIREIEDLKNRLCQCRANLKNAKEHILYLEGTLRLYTTGTKENGK